MISAVRKIMVVLAAVVAFLMGSAWQVFAIKAGEMRTEQKSVEIGQAKSARVNLRIDTASLNVHSGSTNLMEATFKYNVPEWKPVIGCNTKHGVYRLNVSQPETDDLVNGNAKNEWDLAFNDSVPLDMNIKTASGASTLGFSKLCITRMKVVAESGSTILDLSGVHKELNAVNVENESGSFRADLNGCYSSLARINITSESGSIDLNLSGEWENNCNVTIKNESGIFSLKLPRNVGVRVCARNESGTIRTSGLKKVDGAYVNTAYDQAKTTLNINIESESGCINLDVAK